jgi:hypothetical protein
MKRIALILIAVCWFGVMQAEESSSDGEGLLGVDVGFSWGHFYGSPFPDALGANIGFHYEPALTQELNLVVAAKYHAMYWADNDGVAEESIMYHLPQIGVGIKFLLDTNNILPFIGTGFTMNINAYDPNSYFGGKRNHPAGVRFAPGIYLDLGVDIYTSDDLSVGFNARYDWVLDYLYDDSKIPNIFSLNMRINFMTLD